MNTADLLPTVLSHSHLQFSEHTGPYKKKNDNSTVPEVGQVEFTFLAVRFLL
jgi:hypothetical protein